MRGENICYASHYSRRLLAVYQDLKIIRIDDVVAGEDKGCERVNKSADNMLFVMIHLLIEFKHLSRNNNIAEIPSIIHKKVPVWDGTVALPFKRVAIAPEVRKIGADACDIDF